ncbi:Flp pilus assembly complex ATPase component TadA [Thermococcus sp. Bubb.Bath]|uniref:Flp pilus assembly complex ATPase component TadA n=1 Tax=Thermococcus sp. Bubb.Bath TaxID=1638242 RepID=UPI0014392F1B|nr:Flp pilus assembly complex ATPase component TadA [Thermococcus sp. Bubb.Bath]NJF25298.1 ATPase [Thermococcus sp. Bubb.Bath]
MGVYIFTPEDLVRYGSATNEQLEVLKGAILSKKDILIAGSSRSGKTKLVEALTHFIPDDWKVAVVTAYGEFKPFKPNIVVVDTQFGEKPLKNRTNEVISRIREIDPDYVVVDTIHTISVSNLFDVLIDDYAFIVTSLAMTDDIKSEVMHWLGITEEVFRRFDIVVSLKRDFRTGERSIDRIYEVKDGTLEPVL